MQGILTSLSKIDEYPRLLSSAEKRKPCAVTGAGAVFRALFSALLVNDLPRGFLFICAEDEIERFCADMEALLGVPVTRLCSRDFVFYPAEAASRQYEQRRLRALYSMATDPCAIVAATPEALMQRTIPREKLLSAADELVMGRAYELDELVRRLVRAGYERAAQVEGPGQFAVRGGILDFYSAGQGLPVRAEFFGDELDSMGVFDVSTQRRTENIERALILPSCEALPCLHDGGAAGLTAALEAMRARVAKRRTPHEKLLANLDADLARLADGRSIATCDRYMALLYPEFETAMDYVPEGASVVVCQHGAVLDGALAYEKTLGSDLDMLLGEGLIAGELADLARMRYDFEEFLAKRGVVYLDSFASAAFPKAARPHDLFTLVSKQLPSYGGSLETAVSDIKHYSDGGFKTVVLCGGTQRARTLEAMLLERGIAAYVDSTLEKPPAAGRVCVGVGSLSSGFELTNAKLAVITEGQLLARRDSGKKPKRKKDSRERVQSYADLHPGDLIVHQHHGIGRFVGVETKAPDGVERDYIKIAYQGSDCLYIPATSLDLISKYVGAAEGADVRLNKLGGDAWAKTKARAKAAAKDLAEGLIALYAQRRRTEGFAFSGDSEWQREFEESFEYDETEDQLRSIAEVKDDMERPVPMDRLLCGDVGFGKTEVALRAVMKCILDGKQAAILVPTTVLAQQHYLTCLRRFSGFPVQIELLSRFRTPAQMKRSIEKISLGSADLVIGTHRLLQKDVKFKDLGLLIVDEEQRFGVTHKERLKEIAKQVDSLTLTATPIPRTLNMALSGIRDMSVLEEPPRDRLPIQTYVLEHDWAVVGDAIRRELGRGGQTYYLYNRVETISRAAAKVKKLDENLRVEVAHGQMSEDELSGVMQRMADGEIDVLVCTTIIETGIDIPNVNTLIIEDADRLGLSQLHQLRGRVGRSSRRAFAYLTYRPGRVLSETASKRLEAIREFAQFGSGFKIAMRDLEIRGAGNVLGAEQSGHMLSVGYDMYLQLLEEAVLEQQGKPVERLAECTADLPVSANIPDSYIPASQQRMDFYRKIAAIRTEDDADDVTDELIDRYGEPPKGVFSLINVALLRACASKAGIREIAMKNGRLIFKLARVDFPKISSACGEASLKGRVLFSAGDDPHLALRTRPGENILNAATDFVRLLS